MITSSFSGGGYNPIHGRDRGPPPPGTRRSIPPAMPNPASYPHGYYHPWASYYYYPVPPPPAAIHPTYPQASHTQQMNPYSPSALVPTQRLPQPAPAITPSMPAANMTNSTGGVGCEPGYNYFFPPEHTKIIVLQCGKTPPWQLNPTTTFPQISCHVPTKTTVAELMEGFGANNPDKRLNTVTEVAQGGNGKWIKGLSFSGADKKDLKLTIGEVGWDKSRTGRVGEKPVVYLYFTKE